MASNTDPMTRNWKVTEKGKITAVPAMFHSVSKSGRYKIDWTNFKKPGAYGLCKFLWEGSKATIPSKTVLDVELPVKSPDFKQLNSEEAKHGMSVTWLGHACVLVQMDGIRFLTDPVFSSKCGPSSFGFQFGIARYRDAPCSIDCLPKINAVVISHNHYDHLDYHSVCELVKHFPDVIWFVPMGVKTLMQSFGCKNVEECEWWSWCKVDDVQFTFVPAQHWSKRGLTDDDTTLWGGWCVKGPHKNFYFAGDTGYWQEDNECDNKHAVKDGSECNKQPTVKDSPLFKEIGKKLGPFDLAAIPIGAYSPRWFMRCQHINPEEALKIHRDVQAKKSIGIHWGTFNLSNEPYLEPKETIGKLQDGGDDFFTINLGETRFIQTQK